MAYNESQVHKDEINETMRNHNNHKPLTTREEAIKRIYQRQHGQKFSYITDRTGLSQGKMRPLASISAEEMTAELEVMKDPLAKRFRDVVLERISSRKGLNPPIDFAEIKAEEKKFIQEIGEKAENELKRRTPGASEKAYEALLSPRELAAHKKRTDEYFEKRRTTPKNGGKYKKRTVRLHKKYKNKRRTHRK
jgi:hypothetical protein